VGAAEDDDFWGFGGVREELGEFGADGGVVALVVFFDGVSETWAGKEGDVLTGFLIFFKEKFGAFGGDGARSGEN